METPLVSSLLRLALVIGPALLAGVLTYRGLHRVALHLLTPRAHRAALSQPALDGAAAEFPARA